MFDYRITRFIPEVGIRTFSLGADNISEAKRCADEMALAVKAHHPFYDVQKGDVEQWAWEATTRDGQK